MLKSRLIFFSAIILVTFIFFGTLSHYFGGNPTNDLMRPPKSLSILFPQGWGFFTKKSDGPQAFLFRIRGEQLEFVDQRSFTSKFYWGLSRDNRRITGEVGQIMEANNFDSLKFFKINLRDVDSLRFRINPDTLAFNEVHVPKKNTITGNCLVVYRIAQPWYLYHRKSDYNNPYIVYPMKIKNDK